MCVQNYQAIRPIFGILKLSLSSCDAKYEVQIT
jgi:hypothetical protein